MVSPLGQLFRRHHCRKFQPCFGIVVVIRPAISADSTMLRRGAKPATPLLTLRWTLSAKRACVVSTDTEPDGLAPLAPPAPTPRGLGGGGALLPPARSRGALYVQAQTCAAKDAVCIQDTFAGGRQRDRRPSANASEFETGAGACAVARSEWRHNRHRHAHHRLAAAHGARLPGRCGAQETRASA